jgi:CheY-like chemotaxis protein
MPESAKKILLVDDSDAESYLISSLISQAEGLKLIWRATNGDAALMYLEGQGTFQNRDKFPLPDVMLLDLNMPQRNGFEVLERLKTFATRPKVVILTSCDDPAAEQRAMELGADAFKVKPYEVLQYASFIEWLRNWLHKHDSRPPLSDRLRSLIGI